MKKYKTVTKKVSELDSVKCDFCGKIRSWDISLGKTEFIEAQNFVHIEKTNHYGSILGDTLLDNEKIELDICEECFKKYILDKIKE
jgi:hypothetical protein